MRSTISRVTLAMLSMLGVMGQEKTEKRPESGYLQKLRDYSFDMGMMHEYPINWETYSSAVPIMSKVKVLPNIPNSSGQFFLKKELETPAWDVTYQIGIEQSESLKQNKINEMVDLFACWYLLMNPKIRPDS